MRTLEVVVYYQCGLFVVLLSGAFGSFPQAPGEPGSSQKDVEAAITQSRASLLQPTDVSAQQLNALLTYIQETWDRLTRSNHNLVAAAADPKHPPVRGRWPVYVANTEAIDAIRQELLQQLPKGDIEKLEIIALKDRAPQEHGILYLPRPYVVPGGRFNEMYAWDSYFIVLGLLRAGKIELARDMVDNALYEVCHYGTFLNANRSYYLTRSQPPMLTGMVLAVFDATHDEAWLAKTRVPLGIYERFWRSPPHHTVNGLSRYIDTGYGPAPEVVSGEIDANGEGAYARMRHYFKNHLSQDPDLSRFYDAGRDALTDSFFVGDRSMRESGFDPSARFGPFNADVTKYNPICLNSLLVVADQQMARIHAILNDKAAQMRSLARATARANAINSLNWDAESGLYLDYDFIAKRRHAYPFATTFYPLWAGLASSQQAAQIVANLPQFEQAGGLMASTQRSGNQWDAPYGWAPLHLFAVQGLRRYGYHVEANRLSINFLSLILQHFVGRGTVFEKYDVSDRDPQEVGQQLQFGYTSNEIGFGWTNAVFVELYTQLPEVLRPLVRLRAGVGTTRTEGLGYRGTTDTLAVAAP